MKYVKLFKFIALGTMVSIGYQLSADIEEDRTNSIGRGDWQTGLQVPSDDQANDACSIVAGLPFSCTLPSSGGGTVTCSPVSIPGGLTLSSSCVLAGSSPSDFSLDVQFDDGVSDPVTQTINLTAGPNQSPTASDPSGCATPKSGFAWTCDLAGSVTDPESQAMTYSLGSSAPSWASLNGSVLSGTPSASGSVGVPYDISDGVNIISYTYNISITAGGGELLADPSATVTPTAMTEAGVNSDVVTAVSGNTCGSSGTASCTDAFNSAKATATECTAPSAADGASAMNSYVNCVMIHHHSGLVASIPATDTVALADGEGGCSAEILLETPVQCPMGQWDCTLQSTTSDTITMNNEVVKANLASTANALNATYVVQMQLNIYTPPYTKTVTRTANFPAGGTQISDIYTTTNGLPGSAWNYCIDQGGTMATQSQLTTAQYNSDDFIYAVDLDWDGNCGSGWNAAPYRTKNYGSYRCKANNTSDINLKKYTGSGTTAVNDIFSGNVSSVCIRNACP